MSRGNDSRRLDPADFAAARVLVNISPTRVEAARLVLVEGHAAQAVADHFGVTRQAVAASVHVIRAAVERWQEAQRAAAMHEGGLLPRGWRSVRLVAPSELLPKLQALIDAETAAPVSTRQRRRALSA